MVMATWTFVFIVFVICGGLLWSSPPIRWILWGVVGIVVGTIISLRVAGYATPYMGPTEPRRQAMLAVLALFFCVGAAIFILLGLISFWLRKPCARTGTTDLTRR